MRVEVSSEWNGFFFFFFWILFFISSGRFVLSFALFPFSFSGPVRTFCAHCMNGVSIAFPFSSLVFTTASCFSCLLNATLAPAPSCSFFFYAMDFQWSLKRPLFVHDHWALLLIFPPIVALDFARLVFVVDSCYGWLGGFGLAGFGLEVSFCR